MPEITPFPAIRFDQAPTGGDLSALLAPPYDVLDQSAKDQLLAQSGSNIVGLDLPHVPPKQAGPPEAYARSAKLLEQGLADGVFIREQQPALYVYHQQFEHDGQSYTRRQFIARCRLTPFSEGIVLPHELTFGGPKEDRFALMKATQCNLSAILALYTDADDRVGKAFASIIEQEPAAHGRVGDVDNRMWVVTDSSVIEAVTSTLAGKRIYIADGHHRYETALQYRDWLAAKNGGSLPEDHPANYLMVVLASMDDPGCLILPYCRALAGVGLATVLDAWAPATEAAETGTADLVLQDGGGKKVPLRYSDRDKLRSLEPDQCEPWYDLDAAYLHRYLLEELLTAKLGHAPDVRYVKSAKRAIETAQSDSGVALLVKATPMAHFRAVSEAGGLMPQKSTYFHPKLATGLTINPLE